LNEHPIDSLWRSARKLGRNNATTKALPPLLFFTDPLRTPRIDLTLARLPRGSGVVFRAFGGRDASSRGAPLARLARRRGVLFLVGADARLAVALRADGIHLPERMVDRAGDIRLWRRRFLVTAAAHNLPAAIRARRARVDALVISSVFSSRSPSVRKPMGVLAFTAMVRCARVPAYALGGVNTSNAARLGGSGAVGLAGVDAFHRPPAGTTRT